jgi:hypothetical protein
VRPALWALWCALLRSSPGARASPACPRKLWGAHGGSPGGDWRHLAVAGLRGYASAARAPGGTQAEPAHGRAPAHQRWRGHHMRQCVYIAFTGQYLIMSYPHPITTHRSRFAQLSYRSPTPSLQDRGSVINIPLVCAPGTQAAPACPRKLKARTRRTGHAPAGRAPGARSLWGYAGFACAPELRGRLAATARTRGHAPAGRAPSRMAVEYPDARTQMRIHQIHHRLTKDPNWVCTNQANGYSAWEWYPVCDDPVITDAQFVLHVPSSDDTATCLVSFTARNNGGVCNGGSAYVWIPRATLGYLSDDTLDMYLSFVADAQVAMVHHHAAKLPDGSVLQYATPDSPGTSHPDGFTITTTEQL